MNVSSLLNWLPAIALPLPRAVRRLFVLEPAACARCRYWRPPLSAIPPLAGRHPRGMCLRRAPSIREYGDDTWPKTLGTGWCGEFERGQPREVKNR